MSLTSGIASSRARVAIVEKVALVENLCRDVTETRELLELGASEHDEAVIHDMTLQADAVAKRVRQAELQRMLSGPVDHANAIVSVHPGSGGAEAKDAEIVPGAARASIVQ